jgi:hypothetical protein
MDKIAILNDSRMARIVFDAFKQVIEKQKSDLLARLLAETKAGPVDPQTYAKFLGGISALEELESVIKRQVFKGEKIERELLDAATRNPR